jgi:HSP20 family protein
MDCTSDARQRLIRIKASRRASQFNLPALPSARIRKEENAMASKVTSLPIKTDNPAVPVKQSEGFWHSFAGLRDDVDRMFDSFMRGFPTLAGSRRASEPLWKFETSFGMAAPAVDVAEKETSYEITAELPGLDAQNVDLSISGDILTVKGEKQEEKEHKAKNYYLSERRYGAFQRSFELPAGVDRDKIEAKFEKGVLTVTLPKTAQAVQQQKKIDIQSK